MKLKYGMPTLIEYNTLEENVKLCSELELSFIELNLGMSYCLPENNSIDNLIKLKEKHKLEFILYFPEEIDFGSPYREIQNANIALFKRFVDYGRKIGVPLINIHLLPGRRVILPDRDVWLNELRLDNYITLLKTIFKQLVDIADSHQILVCVENCVMPVFFKQVLSNLREVAGLYFTYNVGHDAKTNYILKSAFYNIGNRVKHIHLHDYDKNNDHQVLFKGIINLYDKLDFARKHKTRVLIEMKTVADLRTSVHNLKMRHLI